MKQMLTRMLVLSLGLFLLTSCRAEIPDPAMTEMQSDTTSVAIIQTEPEEMIHNVTTELMRDDTQEILSSVTEMKNDYRKPPGEITWDIRYYRSMEELSAAMDSDPVLADSLGDVYTLSGLPQEYEMHGIEHVIGDDTYTFSYTLKDYSEGVIAMNDFRTAAALEANLLYLLNTDGTPDGLRRNNNLRNLRVSEEETPWGTMLVTVYDTSVMTDLKTTYLDFTDENGVRRVLIRQFHADGTQGYCRLYVFDRTCPMRILFSAPLDNELLFSLTAKPIS